MENGFLTFCIFHDLSNEYKWEEPAVWGKGNILMSQVLAPANNLNSCLSGRNCSSCMASAAYEQTNNLSRSQSSDFNFSEKFKEATYLRHPEECSTVPFVSAASLCSMNVPVTEVGSAANSGFSAVLPGPGEPGAPALPPQLQHEQEEECTTTSDNAFLTLRSRSLLPQ